jgi:hypothetical protein
VPGSRCLRRVKVPLSSGPRADIQKWGQCLTGRRAEEGMKKSIRARRRKLDTAKTDLKPLLAVLRRAGCSSRGGIRRACREVPGRNRWGNSQDEPVGPRWGKVESALLRRRRSHSPTAPRCLRAARYRRTARDLRRTGRVSGWHRSKRTYKRKRSGE